MSRHSIDTKKKEISAIDKERNRVLKDFFKLDIKAMAHLEDSIKATKICTNCDAAGKAVRQDKDGKCVICHGTQKVPDVSRRNWASEEIFSRISPKPKAVEMSVDDKKDTDVLAKDFEKLSDKKLDELVKGFGIKFSEEK